MSKAIPISQLPLGPRQWYILCTACMEQIIGGALNTVIGIIIPLILLLGAPHLTSFEQGILGAIGLVGIALGSFCMGRLMDEMGYLFLFRLCPVLIMLGSLGVYFSNSFGPLLLFLFLAGLGVGGGYSLDSGYISELMPAKWESFFVGLAKATSSLGFFGGAAVSYIILKEYPFAGVWHSLIILVGALGLLAFLLRLRWYQSPAWLIAKGRDAKAQKAAKAFLGPDAEAVPPPAKHPHKQLSWLEMFTGERLKKVMLSGVSWACEGLGVYGFGVFLPILIIALGLQGETGDGIPKILSSVKSTAFINIFIGVGFGLGLAILPKINMLRLMGWSFILCALSLLLLLAAYQLHWAAWISFLNFVVFETALNAGPHLVTFIVPSKIYAVDERGAGMGIATLLGKVGAIAGVFFMPLLLELGGVSLVLLISIAIMLAGAWVTFHYGKSLNLL